MAAETGDRATQHRLDVLALADFAGNTAGNALVGGTPHELKSLAHSLIGRDVQIGRLLKLHRQRLLQRAVEYGIAGGVHKFGEQNGIFFGELLSAVRPRVQAASD